MERIRLADRSRSYLDDLIGETLFGRGRAAIDEIQRGVRRMGRRRGEGENAQIGGTDIRLVPDDGKRAAGYP